MAIEAVRGGWLTLCFMMLLSRVVFQAQGAERMRAFLTGWQQGGVKRVWGSLTLAYAGVLAIAAASSIGKFGAFDLALLAALWAVLLADGSVNVLPAGFETFKDRMQAAWVRRNPDRADDRHLFGTVNALLALASAGAAAVVLAYRPVEWPTVAAAAAVAVTLTGGLIFASQRA
jgi:hypothetical protein